MSQLSAAPSSFTVTCPGCGQKLRFLVNADTPPRLRIQCASCRTAFGVRRPGADPGEATMVGAPPPPTLVGMPVQSPTRVGVTDQQTSPLPSALQAGAVPAPRREQQPAFSPGNRIAGRYRVVRFIARGGMGEVYEVDDLELKERVALKTVRSEVGGDEIAIERFRREIQLARKVTHPNVCRIFDVSYHRPEGGGAETIFLTMELLPGATLAERLRSGGPMRPEEALPIARQVAEALQAAHEVGVVHRDLKPGNVVLVEGRGGVRAVVTDFGLARLESGAEDRGLTLTAHAGVVGTPAYLAPEQIEGKEITPAVDIYAFGIVLYEMLTGKVPFIGDTALSTAVKRLQEAPASPRVHVPDLGKRWESAILRCLAREPSARFPTALAAVDAITQATRGEMPAFTPPTPAPAVPAPAPSRPVSGAGGRRLKIALLAALVLAAAAVGWIRYGQWRQKQLEPEQRLALLTERITPRRSVAVLGFRNLSGTPGTEWLSAGLAEMLSTELGSGGKLRIIAGENVARAKMELRLGDADSLGRDTLARLRTLLGTDAVVVGSYATLAGPQGRTIRLDLRLQDAARGETTATVAEAGNEALLFDLVSRVGESLRKALGVTAEGAAQPARSALPESAEAARLYAEGVQKLRLFDPVGARDLLTRAAAAEPGNALVHSGLSAAWAALGFDGKAREEAKRALDLAAGLPQEDRLLIEGRYLETVQDWGRATEIYWSLWSLFPDNLDYGLRLAAAQASAGKADEALATAEALRALPAPSGEDPRIDLAEATAAGARANFGRQRDAAARAAGKGKAQGAPLMVAQARLLECRALRNLGQAREALAACEEGLQLYAGAGDRAGGAEAQTHAANVLYDRGDLDDALGRYEQALAIYREIGNRAAEAGALNNIAVVLKSRGDLDRARQLYEEVLAICREIGSKSGEALTLNNLAGVLLRRGDLAEAGKLFEQALSLQHEQGDRSGEAYALDNIGVVLRKRGDLAGARRRHEESLRIRQEIGQKIGEVASLNNLGAVLLEQGELAAARKQFQASTALCRETGSKSASAYALFGLGEVLAREGNLVEARKRHEAALSLRTDLGERATAAESRQALAALYLDGGDPLRAEQEARTAAGELARQGAADGEALALATAALAASARGDEGGARAAIDRAVPLVANSQNLRARLAVDLAAARLRRTANSAVALQGVLTQATQAGLLDLQLEARLALADLGGAQGTAQRAALQQEAKALGYELIARKAGRGL